MVSVDSVYKLVLIAMEHGWKEDQIEIFIREDEKPVYKQVIGYPVYLLPQSHSMKLLVCVIDHPWYVYLGPNGTPIIKDDFPAAIELAKPR